MKRLIALSLILLLASCAQPTQVYPTEPDGGIGGTGTKSPEVR
ncbi:hypothetical protein [Parasulfitobacter algicola]|nr:hypothetical protein [Sulfitobacter algicola]